MSEKDKNENSDKSKESELPYIIEVFFMISRLVVGLSGIITVVTSLVMGSSFVNLMMKTGVVMFGMGVLMFWVTKFAMRATLTTVEGQLRRWNGM